MMRLPFVSTLPVVVLTMLWGLCPTAANEDAASIRFPERRPPGGKLELGGIFGLFEGYGTPTPGIAVRGVPGRGPRR